MDAPRKSKSKWIVTNLRKWLITIVASLTLVLFLLFEPPDIQRGQFAKNFLVSDYFNVTITPDPRLDVLGKLKNPNPIAPLIETKPEEKVDLNIYEINNYGPNLNVALKKDRYRDTPDNELKKILFWTHGNSGDKS